MSDHIDIVFSGPPGSQGARFLEIESGDPARAPLTRWLQRSDGRWVLRIQNPPGARREDEVVAELASRLRARMQPIRRSQDGSRLEPLVSECVALARKILAESKSQCAGGGA